MKLLSIPAAFLVLTPLLGAKQGNPTPYPAAEITSVEPALACLPGSIAIRGKNLGLTRGAWINGNPVRIVRNTGNLVVIHAPPQDPGTGKVELAQPKGTAMAPIELLPSLHADAMGGSSLSVGLYPGAPSIYVVNYSNTTGSTPFYPIPAYYHSMLDLTVPRSGMVGMGSSDGSPFHVVEALPLGMIGFPVHVQALCWYTPAIGDLVKRSYSNVASVTM